MADVKIRLRFYLPHDMDLISLMITHEMDIVQAMYCAVSAFVKHETFAIKIPPLRDVPMEKKRVFHRNLSLNPEKDKEAIELLACIEPGYRNNFLKNILRLYLFCPATEAFLTNPGDIEKFESFCEPLKNGKRVADAATIKTKRRKPQNSINKKEPEPFVNNGTKEENINIEKAKNSTFDIDKSHFSKESDLKDFSMEESHQVDNFDEDTDELTDLFTGLLG